MSSKTISCIVPEINRRETVTWGESVMRKNSKVERKCKADVSGPSTQNCNGI